MTSELAHSFVLAESFDAMPDALYDVVEAFTAPTLEPEYLDYSTCLYCDDSRVMEAINQYHQDVSVPCPHCQSEDRVQSKPRFNIPAIYLTIYNRLEQQGKLTIWERKHRDSLLKVA